MTVLRTCLFACFFAASLFARQEPWSADGFEIEVQEVPGQDGSAVLDGPFRAQAADGRKVEGAYAQGLASGRWRFVNAAGKSIAIGPYIDGERSGTWTHRAEGGALLAKGQCSEGRPAGPWTFYLEGGKRKVVDPSHSGDYAWTETSFADGQRRAAGLLLDGQPHGPWTFWWPNGQPMLRGHLERGRWAGGVEFAFPSGHRDEGFMGAGIEAPVDLTWLAEGYPIPGQPAPARPLAELPAATADALGELPARLDLPVETASHGAVHEYAAAFDGILAGLRAGKRGLGEVQIAANAMHAALGGRTTGWSWDTPGSDARNIVSAHRARAFFECSKDDAGLWAIGLAAYGSPEPDSDWLPELDARRLAGLPPAERAPLGRHGERSSKNKRRYAIEDSEPALEAALEWLAAHQNADGSFEAQEFQYAQGSDCGCEGQGRYEQDLGVTALALQVFVDDGNTPLAGPYADVVLRGTRWILRQQDRATGAIADVDVGRRPGGKIPRNLLHSSIYDHAMATGYLASLWRGSRKYTYDGPVSRAARYLVEQRSNQGGWHYRRLDGGDGDSSITGWCWRALQEAGLSGIEVPIPVQDGVLGLIDKLTDKGTGRMGYTRPGEGSARVLDRNDHYPNDLTEALTAVGLLLRLQLGESPESQPLIGMHADLMLKLLPEWDPEGLGTDMYYWYYGSLALRRLGGKHWDAWRKALEPAVLEGQVKSGHESGSWDPIGPWGHSGGRVYATAMMASCLQTLMPPLVAGD